MKKGIYLATILCLFFFIDSSSLLAQKDKSERKSPPIVTTQKVGELTVTINYSQPSVKGRKIWGSLVKYDRVWRTGANEATTITFDKDVKVNGRKVTAGTYSLFTIPDKSGEWIVIINSDTDLWGSYDFDKNKNVARFEVETRKVDDLIEKLTFSINKEGAVTFAWEYLSFFFVVSEE